MVGLQIILLVDPRSADALYIRRCAVAQLFNTPVVGWALPTELGQIGGANPIWETFSAPVAQAGIGGRCPPYPEADFAPLAGERVPQSA